MPASSIDHAFTARGNTGAAGDPTYAGALSFMRRRYTKNVKGADVVIWGIPFDAAVTNRPGARFGPQAIRRASAIFDNDPQYPFHLDLFDKLGVVDYGDCLLDNGNHQKTPKTIEREAARLISSGAFLLSLGGDHFVTWPLLKAHAALHGPLALVQFEFVSNGALSAFTIRVAFQSQPQGGRPGDAAHCEHGLSSRHAPAARGRPRVVRCRHRDDAAGDRGRSNVRAPISWPARHRLRIPQRGARAGAVIFSDKNADWEVVGVVDDMRQDSVQAPPQPEVFASFKQVMPSSIRSFDPILVVRTTGEPAGYVSTLRSLVHEQAPTVALDSVMTMEDRVMMSLGQPRLYAVVLVWFGAFALLIAGVGLFWCVVVQRGAAHARNRRPVRPWRSDA